MNSVVAENRFSDPLPMRYMEKDQQAEAARGAHADYLLQLLGSQRSAQGCLPLYLGLRPLEFVWWLQGYLGDVIDVQNLLKHDTEINSASAEKGQLRQQLLELRRDEWRDLRELLVEHRAGHHPLEIAFADILAAGCLGGDHLWRDLGLPTRGDLSELIELNFPEMARKNNQDMKWKKFFYKQLCEREGGYVCRSPSCEDCAAYDDCFGAEE